MKITSGQEFWVVRDPTAISELNDILFKANMDGFQRFATGSLVGGVEASAENWTIYNSEEEAAVDARRRLGVRDKRR